MPMLLKDDFEAKIASAKQPLPFSLADPPEHWSSEAKYDVVIACARAELRRREQERRGAPPELKAAMLSAETKPAAVKRWILDSGASRHMVSEKAVGKKQMYDVDDPISLATASGIVTTYSRAFATVPSLSDDLELVVLPNTPAALSMGMLMEKG